MEKQEEYSNKMNPLKSWFSIRKKSFNVLFFSINRLTALILTGYLFLHLVVLSLLLQGPSSWNQFISLAHSPAFVLLEIGLIFVVLYHGLNGIRVIIVGTGLSPNLKNGLAILFGIIGTIVFIITSYILITY